MTDDYFDTLKGERTKHQASLDGYRQALIRDETIRTGLGGQNEYPTMIAECEEHLAHLDAEIREIFESKRLI